jgi:hypothetical protein
MHAAVGQLRHHHEQSVLFPNAYTWLVLAASLDVIMTYLMLSLGAIEVNAVANHALRVAGLWGLIALKFTIIAGVLWICEFVGRRRLTTARSLVSAGVALNFLPVVFSFAQLTLFFDDWVAVFLRG